MYGPSKILGKDLPVVQIVSMAGAQVKMERDLLDEVAFEEPDQASIERVAEGRSEGRRGDLVGRQEGDELRCEVRLRLHQTF